MLKGRNKIAPHLKARAAQCYCALRAALGLSGAAFVMVGVLLIISRVFGPATL